MTVAQTARVIRPDIGARPDLRTGEVARLLGVAPATVGKWVDRGLLGGYRLPGAAGTKQEDRRVPWADLVKFCRLRGITIPTPGTLTVACLCPPTPGVEAVTPVRLGVLVGRREVGRAVIGCEFGLGEAVATAGAVRDADPGVRLALLMSEDAAGVPAGLFDCAAYEWAGVLAWLVGGAA